MSELKSSANPFEISKWEVWQAYEKVKANKGGPGVDGVDLGVFEEDLQNNLFKIWNRMSSGSYFPPPVRAVEIPKPHGGGTRILGVPTVGDRIAQTVVAARLEQKVEPIFHPDLTATGRGDQRWMRWGHAGRAVGNTTGSSTSMFRSFSTACRGIWSSKRLPRTPICRGCCCM